MQTFLQLSSQYWYMYLAIPYLDGLLESGSGAFSRWSTFCKAITCLAFSFTAPVVMLVGMWTVRKTSKNLPSALRWWDTPDEPDLVDLDMRTTAKLWSIWWRLAVYDWFGLRNRGHGFTQMFAKMAPGHWPRGEGKYRTGNVWLNVKRTGPFLTYFGWQTYSTTRTSTGVEFRPMLSIKYRP